MDAILTAAKNLLIRRGLEGTTTNAIAERAGVSIGSLYQYFHGLDAVVEELSRRHVEQALQVLFAEAEALRDETLEVGLRRLIRMMVELHRQDPELGRVLEGARPELNARTHLARMNQQIMAAACAYLTAHRELIVVDDVERAAFIVVGSIEALTHNAMIQRPELLQGDILVDDVSRLVLGYLTGLAPTLVHPLRHSQCR